VLLPPLRAAAPAATPVDSEQAAPGGEGF
jgi:hypothetical protein